MSGSSSVDGGAVPLRRNDQPQSTFAAAATAQQQQQEQQQRHHHALERPRALPDLEDRSMQNVLEYVETAQQDLFYSFASDLYFLAGGIGYVVLAVGGRLHQHDEASSVGYYRVVAWIAPLVYLANAVVDLEWALWRRRRARQKRDMARVWNDWHLLLGDGPSAAHDEIVLMQQRTGTTHEAAAAAASPKSCCSSPFAFWTRLHKHAAHRRSIWAALTFGLAALLAVLALVVSAGAAETATATTATTAADYCDAASAHAYIVSAAIACSGRRTRPWLYGNGRALWRNPETLEDLGDLLFLIGSVVDAALLDLHLDDNRTGWPILAAGLWCLDACLYLRSDVILADQQEERREREELEGSGVLV